jgi:hypothetical protein
MQWFELVRTKALRNIFITATTIFTRPAIIRQKLTWCDQIFWSQPFQIPTKPRVAAPVPRGRLDEREAGFRSVR